MLEFFLYFIVLPLFSENPAFPLGYCLPQQGSTVPADSWVLPLSFPTIGISSRLLISSVKSILASISLN
jgi:hypothetical protein